MKTKQERDLEDALGICPLCRRGAIPEKRRKYRNAISDISDYISEKYGIEEPDGGILDTLAVFAMQAFDSDEFWNARLIEEDNTGMLECLLRQHETARKWIEDNNIVKSN